MKTKRNFSLGIKIASILSAVAILSVGFASWLIVSAPQDQQFTTGSFTVETVEMKSATISQITATDNTVVFGKGTAPSGEGVTNHGWLKAPSIGEEDLNSSFTFTLASKDGQETSALNLNEVLDKLTIVLTVPEAYKTAAAATPSVLGAPTLTYSYTPTGGTEQTGTANTLTDGTVTLEIDLDNANVNSINVTLNISFAWGAKTGGANPFTYYNAQAYTDDLGIEAKGVLDTVYGLNGQNYGLTISGTLLPDLQ